jgi:serine/threonine-protein kinase
MSPEQAQGDRQVDHRSDLWSLGVIAYQCLTARLPFESEGLGSLVLKICTGPIPTPSSVAEVPPGFDEWFARALNRDPEGRFQSAKEMSRALRAVLTGEENTAQRNWLSAGESAQYPAVAPYQSAASQTGGSGADFTGRHTPYASDLNLTTGHAAASEVGVAARRAQPNRSWLFALLGVLALGGVFAVVAVVFVMKSRSALESGAATPPPPSAPVVASVAEEPLRPPADPPPTPVEPPHADEPAQKPASPVAQTTGKTGVKPVVKEALKEAKPLEKPAEKPAAVEPTAKPPATATSKGRLGF